MTVQNYCSPKGHVKKTALTMQKRSHFLMLTINKNE